MFALNPSTSTIQLYAPSRVKPGRFREVVQNYVKSFSLKPLAGWSFEETEEH